MIKVTFKNLPKMKGRLTRTRKQIVYDLIYIHPPSWHQSCMLEVK